MIAIATVKICTKCGDEKEITDFYSDKNKPDGKYSACKNCHTKINSESQKRNPERRKRARHRWGEGNPDKVKAQNAINNGVRDGKIKRKNCEVCNDVAEAHHEDYDKPLDVIWLCRRHHRNLHERETKCLKVY